MKEQINQAEDYISFNQAAEKKLKFTYYVFLYIGFSFVIAGAYPYIDMLFSEDNFFRSNNHIIDLSILISGAFLLWASRIVNKRQKKLRVWAAIFSLLFVFFSNPIIIVSILSQVSDINIPFEYNVGMIGHFIIIPIGIVNFIFLLQKDVAKLFR